MMRVPFREVYDGPPLFLDYLERFDRVAPLFGGAYKNLAALAERAQRIARPLEPDVARRLSLPSGPVACVLTGQQPGLLGGPLYNALKAIGVIGLAREIERTSGVRTLPVFWNHSDDHSLSEFAAVWTPEGELRLETPNAPAFVSELPLAEAARRFAERAGVDPSAVAASYQGATLADAFTRLLKALFGMDGLIVVEPRDLRRLNPIFERVLRAPQQVHAKLIEGCDRVESLGFEPVFRETLGVGLYRIDGERREKIFLVDGTLYVGQDKATLESLAQTVLSPQGFLRPIFQDAVFPTVAYVGGPNEIRYLAELKPLYEYFGVSMPVVLPRPSATLLDPPAVRLIEKLGLSEREVVTRKFEPPTEGSMADPTLSRVQRLGDDLDKGLADVAQELARLDPSLEAALGKTRTNVRGFLDAFRRRISESASRAATVNRDRVERLMNRVRPAGELQERALAMLYFEVAEPGVYRKLLSKLDPFALGHTIVRLAEL